MTHVLGFIQRDKQTDGLVEKLRHRFDPRAEASINRRHLCISRLDVTEKGLKRLSENFESSGTSSSLGRLRVVCRYAKGREGGGQWALSGSRRPGAEDQGGGRGAPPVWRGGR